MATNHTSYVYVGLAGETAPGRVVKSGLYRMAVGDGVAAVRYGLGWGSPGGFAKHDRYPPSESGVRRLQRRLP